MSMALPDLPPIEPAEKTADPQVARWRSRAWIVRALSPAAQQLLGRPPDPLSVATSYVILRNGIGVLGFAFPIVMVLGGGLDHLQISLSAYYHYSPEHPAQYGAGTMRDLFVGMLCTLGAFLFFYRGHSLQEDIALNIAGVAAVLVALFPTDWPANSGMAMSTASRLHSASATTFFVMIAYVCVFRARDTLFLMDDPKRRMLFEWIYLMLGILMLATPVAVALLEAMSAVVDPGFKILIVEAGGVFVFSSFWLVKSWEIRTSLRTR